MTPKLLVVAIATAMSALAASPILTSRIRIDDPNIPPLGDNSTTWKFTGGPNEVTTGTGGSSAWKWTFTIDPQLGTGVTANSAKGKIFCDGTWKDVNGECITVATAGGSTAQITIKKDGSCPCSGCTNCTKVNVEWQDTSKTPPTKIGVFTIPWPNQQKHPKVEFDAEALPRQHTIVSVSVVDDSGQVVSTFSGDVSLEAHAIGSSVVSFENGTTAITIPVARGHGAARLDLSQATVGDTVWIEASASNMDAHRGSVRIQ